MIIGPAHTKACRHPRPFNWDAGDRVVRTRPEAVRLAYRRAERRGAQVVSRHAGWLFKRGVWYVQDKEAP